VLGAIHGDADRLPGGIGYNGTRRGDLAGQSADGIIAFTLEFVTDPDRICQLGENIVCLLAVLEPLDGLQDLIQVGRLRRAIFGQFSTSASTEDGFEAMRAAASRRYSLPAHGNGDSLPDGADTNLILGRKLRSALSWLSVIVSPLDMKKPPRKIPGGLS